MGGIHILEVGNIRRVFWQDRSGENRLKAGIVQDRTVKARLSATKVCEESETLALDSDVTDFRKSQLNPAQGSFPTE